MRNASECTESVSQSNVRLKSRVLACIWLRLTRWGGLPGWQNSGNVERRSCGDMDWRKRVTAEERSMGVWKQPVRRRLPSWEAPICGSLDGTTHVNGIALQRVLQRSHSPSHSSQLTAHRAECRAGLGEGRRGEVVPRVSQPTQPSGSCHLPFPASPHLAIDDGLPQVPISSAPTLPPGFYSRLSLPLLPSTPWCFSSSHALCLKKKHSLATHRGSHCGSHRGDVSWSQVAVQRVLLLQGLQAGCVSRRFLHRSCQRTPLDVLKIPPSRIVRLKRLP